MTLRYDIHPLKATLTADGYLVDRQAIIARTGIQLYQMSMAVETRVNLAQRSGRHRRGRSFCRPSDR